MSAYDMWLDPPDDVPETLEDDAEPDDYPFEVGDWRSDERCMLLERRYE
ncbi:hypothetical protein [Pseudomonas sp.]